LAGVVTLGLSLNVQSADAMDSLRFSVPDGTQDTLRGRLRAGSLLRQNEREDLTEPQDTLAAALADYRRLTEVLYANGYYSGVISIRIDGQEAALIAPGSAPNQIHEVTVNVEPGKRFKFGRADLSPLAPGTELPKRFRTGAPARADTIGRAANDAINAWRAAGHAKARITTQDVTADHAAARLDALLRIAPGPSVTFGELRHSGSANLRGGRITEIAGLPTGAPFNPAEVERAATRLRRSGVFSSVALNEAEELGPEATLDIEAALVESRPRRFGAGVEVSTQSGLQLSGFWMHRNLLGGAERLRVEGEVRDLALDGGEVDYALGVRIDRPASFGADTTAFATLDLRSEQEPLFDLDQIDMSIGATRYLTDNVVAEAQLRFSRAQTNDAFGNRRFTLLSTPLRFSWDRRDDTLNPQKGQFLETIATPYLGLDGSESGTQFVVDGRRYEPLMDGRVIAAARVQLGSVAGSSVAGTAPALVFQSGGGGTVRGQPFQSLGVSNGTEESGGRSFIGLSGEIRAELRRRLGLVGFADAGFIGAGSAFEDGAWHAGAGLGLRYDTSVGPIRFDVGVPVSGNTGSGTQFYIGIGQAF
jgi:translocation and assembly module TamA